MSENAPVAGSLAPRRRRLALAYGYVAGIAVAAVAAVAVSGRGGAALELLGGLVMVVCWFLLRRATRLVVDAPATELADRLVRLRDRMFVLAYQVLGAVGVLVAAVLFVGSSSGDLAEGLSTALAWVLFGSALGLPLIVAAVALPDDATVS